MKEGHVIAVSGECDAIIYTRARLQEHGRVIENPYLVVLFPGDGEIYEMEMPTLSAVIQWAHHMEPQILYVRTAGREQGEDDCDEIIALCRGTSHIVMSPLEFMRRLAALVPRPRLHLMRFHGVLAPDISFRRATNERQLKRNATVSNGSIPLTNSACARVFAPAD